MLINRKKKQRHTDKHTETHTHRQTHRHTHRQTHTDTHTDTHTYTQRHTHTHTQAHTYTHTWIARKLNYFSFLLIVFIYGFLTVRLPDHEMCGWSYEKCRAVLFTESRTVYRLLHLLVLSYVQIGEVRSLYQEKLSVEATFALTVSHSVDYRYKTSIICKKFRQSIRVPSRASYRHSYRDVPVTGTNLQ